MLVSAIHQNELVVHTRMSPLFQISCPLRSAQSREQSSQRCTAGSHCCCCCCCCCITSVVSDSVRPHRRQPTRLRHPWDSPDKSTGVGCHFLLQCRKVKSENEVAQSLPTLSNPMDCSPPGFSVHGVFQVRGLESGAITLSKVLISYLVYTQ